jgi:hypothetical protein
LIVGRETAEAAAKFRCSQRNSALAALIISLVRDMAGEDDALDTIFNTSGIDSGRI